MPWTVRVMTKGDRPQTLESKRFDSRSSAARFANTYSQGQRAYTVRDSRRSQYRVYVSG